MEINLEDFIKKEVKKEIKRYILDELIKEDKMGTWDGGM
jgi:hypothetical protein